MQKSSGDSDNQQNTAEEQEQEQAVEETSQAPDIKAFSKNGDIQVTFEMWPHIWPMNSDLVDDICTVTSCVIEF